MFVPQIPKTADEVVPPGTVIPEINELYKELKALDAKPNVISSTEFKQFEPLFRKDHGLTRDQIEDLTQLFVVRLDLYKPTHITQAGRVVLRLPAVFVTVQSMASNKRTERLVAGNIKDHNNQLPKISSQVFNDLMVAWKSDIASHMGEINEVRVETRAIADEFRETYEKRNGVGVSLTKGKEIIKDTVVKEPDGIEWE